MKKALIFTFLFLFAIHSLAQEIFKSGQHKPYLGMKGKVKTSTEETYDLKWENDEIVREYQGKMVYDFSKDGKLIKKTTLYDDYESTIVYSRFEDGRAMRIDQTITQPHYTDKDSTRIFVIDNYNDRLVTWRNYNSEYAQTDTTLIRYLGEMTEITPLSNIRKLSITETRDSRGNLIRETRTLRGRTASWCMWDYDENGLLISEFGTEPGAFGVMDDYSFFYEYQDFDKRGNWRRKLVKQRGRQYDEESEMIPTRIIERKIKYY